jgi:HAD superfamily, subfamily IIIB (Acid phosphatase)
MRNRLASLRHMHPARIAVVAVAALVVSLVVAAGAVAIGQAVPAPPANPTSADQIQNVDQVKTAIKKYYGDTVSSTLDPVNGTTLLHFASPTSAYANEMAGIENSAEQYLADAIKPFNGHGPRAGETPAVVFDIDDTTLNTYSYEIYSGFVFNPTTNAAFVNSGVFPAVFGMPALVNQAQADGYTVFFLTGRPISQTAGTAANLVNVGYPTVPASQLYLKDTSAPWLASCGGASCTTDQYKSLTRQHIESLGYDIVGNFGDQFSDLSFGFEDKAFKLPNPMYFLP